MAKPIIVLVHGMGQHTTESFSKEFSDGLDAAFALYPSLRDKSPSDFYSAVSVDYNAVFDEFRSERTEAVSSYSSLAESLQDSGLFKKVIRSIAGLDTAISQDEFLATHLMDVVLYRFTELGEKARIILGQAIADCVADHHSSNVHIVAHSLGAALAHDTLASVYRPEYVPVPSQEKFQNLSTISQRLNSLHMIANTSSVLESFIAAKDSIVKPGVNGCLHRYHEYRHAYDPITWVDPFSPTDNGVWVSESDYNRKYKLVRTTSLTNENGNVHQLEHYLFNPLVHLEIFKCVLGIDLSAEEIEEGRLIYRDQTLRGVSQKLEDEFRGVSISNAKHSIRGLFDAFSMLKNFVEKLGEQYEF